MKLVPFDDASCKRVRARLDAYLSDELALEPAAEVAAHLEACEACSAELAAMQEVRHRLREAVRAEAAPGSLRDGVERRLHAEYRRGPARWLAVAAALAISLGAGLLVSERVTGYLPLELLTIELEVRSLVGEVAAAYAPAIIDHLHCAVYRSGAKSAVTNEKAAMELGSEAPIAEMAHQAVGRQATMFVAHRCRFGGRDYVHMILMDGDALVSVVVTEKQAGEALGAEPSATRAGRFEIAGFETSGRLAFVISDLSAERNLEIARELQGPLEGFLG